MRQDQDASSDMLLCAKTVWPFNGGESLDFNDWRVGFIGHRPNGRFVEKFCDSDERIMTSERVRMKKLTWPDAPADQEFSRHVHFIRVELFDDGIFKGSIRWIEARHLELSKLGDLVICVESRQSTKNEIAGYCNLLLQCISPVSFRYYMEDVALRMFKAIVLGPSRTSHEIKQVRNGDELRLFVDNHWVSAARMAKFIEQAFWCPDAWQLTGSGLKNNSSREESDFTWFIHHFSISAYYTQIGINYKSVFRGLLSRLTVNSREISSYLGMSESLCRALIESRLSDIVDSKDRDLVLGQIILPGNEGENPDVEREEGLR